MLINLVVLLVSTTNSEVVESFPSGYSINVINEVSTISIHQNEGFYSSMAGDPFLPLVSKVFLIPGNVELLSSSLSFEDNTNNAQLTFPLAGTPVINPIGTEQERTLLPTTQFLGKNDQHFTVHTGHILNSFTIISCSINPWLYNPLTQELTLYSSFTISIETENSYPSPPLSSLQTELLNFRLNALSDEYNADFINIPSYNLSDGITDYLIITSNNFISDIISLELLLQNKGLSFTTITVEDIEGNWYGLDVQEDIRNCIKYYVQNEGTAFVVLAGDETVVPARMVYTECEGLSEFAPVDMYYADLDGNWDANNNGIYGEADDNLDLYSDVLIGRILFSTSAGANAFFDKNTAYASTSTTENWYKQVVLCGGMLFPEIGYNGAKACEIQSLEYPNDFNLIKAYELTIGDYPDTYLAPLYAGSGWNHYAGHGNYRGIYWGDFTGILTISRMGGFTNTNQTGIHSGIGCHTGDFAREDACLPDTLLTLANGGGVAAFFNTTWGWEGYWPEIGASERLCINTVSQTYQNKASSLGLAYTVAKDLEVARMTGPYDRIMQSVLAFTAFIDPALEVLGVSGSNPIPPAQFKIILYNANPLIDDRILDFKVTGVSNIYDITIFDIAGKAVVEPFQLNQNLRHTINLNKLSNGIYFVSARAPNSITIAQSFILL